MSLLSLAWAIYASYAYFSLASELKQTSAQHARAESHKLVGDIKTALSPLPPLAEQLAKDLAAEAFNAEELEKRLKKIVLSQAQVAGIGVAFEPYAFDPTQRLYAPYYLRQDQQLRRVDVAEHYDYTEAQYNWYRDSLSEPPAWNEIYFGQISRSWLVEYLVPVVKDGVPVGLIFINYALEDLQKRIDLLDLGERGYSYIVDKNGRLVDYPILEEVEAETTLTRLADFADPSMKAVAQRILAHEEGQAQYWSSITNKASLLHYTPVSDLNWAVLTVFEEPNTLTGDPFVQRQIIHLLMSWCVFLLLSVGAWLAALTTPKLYVYWYGVFIISVTLTLVVMALWYLTLNAEHVSEDNVTPIVNHADLNVLKKRYTRESLLSHRDPPLYIPTGVFVQSIEFTSANNVILTGYVWQRYLDTYHKGLSRGFLLPEAESLEVEEAYRRKEKAGELIGWYFRVTLRQNFDYGHYPLDRQSVWMRLWHKDFDRNVVLIPDLTAYDQLNPDWLPGVEKDFVLSGWSLWRSFFNYHHNSYNTNFGIDNYVGQNRFPELYFNIALKREFFDPFVSKLAPIVVVLLMLFAVLVTSSKDKERSALLGFNTAGVLASSSALFFVVLLSHIDLRGSLAAKEIIYLENYYFVTYLALLVVAINSILFSWGIRFPSIGGVSLIQQHDNLIPKLLFWPMITGQLLVLTLVSLYPRIV